MWLGYIQHPSIEEWIPQAFRFSSKVSLETPAELLMEVGSVLRYFGGISRLLGETHQAISFSHWALTPFPEATLWCARAGLNQVVNPEEYRAILRALPIDVLRLAPETHTEILRCGIRSIGALDDLPKAAVARRWGKDLVLKLDSAFVSPRPRSCLSPPEAFYQEQSLDDPVFEWTYARPVLDSLLQDALRWSAARGLVVRRLQLFLKHGGGRQTVIPVATDWGESEDVWKRLIHLAIETCQLKDWITAFALEITESGPYRPISGDLLPNRSKDLRTSTILQEVLETRLGAEAIQGLYCYPDHRPERAYLEDRPGRLALGPLPAGSRPCWLLDPVRPLGQTPFFKGKLQLVSGPERIEAGWWDGKEVRRDYFVAAHPTGSLYWIYRECELPCHWYLQGIFA